MKVKELRERLETLDQDEHVYMLRDDDDPRDTDGDAIKDVYQITGSRLNGVNGVYLQC